MSFSIDNEMGLVPRMVTLKSDYGESFEWTTRKNGRGDFNNEKSLTQDLKDALVAVRWLQPAESFRAKVTLHDRNQTEIKIFHICAGVTYTVRIAIDG
mmetsp:Transcript_33539/g.83775  ORF Transcript_33539/g.83775 Transcript_33539/m.83775 type:complete len:98 (+) Transcript_33539:52-345(+)|eukprot:4031610-Prymnesium_polylepis.1